MIRDIKEIQALATKYTKPQLARMAQMGLIDPTKAVMAGMMIDRIAKSNAQPPQSTVAEEALAAPQPMGIGALPQQQAPAAGVAALPSGITEMAGGGIVAFDEGGEVPGYADGGRPVSPFGFSGMDYSGPYGPRELEQMRKNAQEAEESRRLRSEALISEIRNKQANNIPLTPAEQALLSRVPAVKTGVETTPPVSDTYPSEGMRGSATFTKPGVTAQSGIINPFADTGEPKQKATRAGIPVAGERQAKTPVVQEQVPVAQQGAFGLPPIDPSVGKFTTEAYPIPEAKDIKGVLKEREEADRLAGVNTDIYKDLMKDLEGKKGRLAERKQEAIGNAIMQTGLGLIGARRGQEFATLGESGQKALQGLVNANEKIRDNEDKLDDARRSLLLAENEYRRTRSDKALEDVQKQRDKIEALQIKNIDNKNDANKRQAEIAVNLQGQQVQMRGQDIQRQTSLEVAKMSKEAQLASARIHAAAANRPGETERLMAEYQTRIERDGKDSADAWLSNLERVRGAGKPQNTFSFEEALKTVANNPVNAGLSPDELARKAQELIIASRQQQQAQVMGPAAGTIQEWDGKKWQFKGGDASKKENWAEVK